MLPSTMTLPTHQLEGRGEETVVLLHGELNDLTSWQSTVATLEQRFRVLRYNRSLSPDMSLEGHGRELESLLDHLNLEHVHLVGHSGGGVLAYTFAGQHPERVLSLCLADSLGKLDAPLETKVRSVLAALEVGGGALAHTVAAPWLWGAEYLTTQTAKLEMIRQRAATLPTEPMRWALEYVLGFGDQRKWLRAVNCPVLVAVGSDDNLTPLRYSHEIVEWVKQGLGVLVTITGGGHNAPLEKPEEFNRILAGFLERYRSFTSSPWDDEEEDSGAEYHDLNDLERN
jgi:pimeloyl-ACP methyl ester carboxylesterase